MAAEKCGPLMVGNAVEFVHMPRLPPDMTGKTGILVKAVSDERWLVKATVEGCDSHHVVRIENLQRQDLPTESEDASQDNLEALRPEWTVVGGLQQKGILVREGAELSSRELSRLSTGARVEELELRGERLHFRRKDGDGPDEGWVSLVAGGKKLLEPVAAVALACPEDAPVVAPPSREHWLSSSSFCKKPPAPDRLGMSALAPDGGHRVPLFRASVEIVLAEPLTAKEAEWLSGMTYKLVVSEMTLRGDVLHRERVEKFATGLSIEVRQLSASTPYRIDVRTVNLGARSDSMQVHLLTPPSHEALEAGWPNGPAPPPDSVEALVLANRQAEIQEIVQKAMAEEMKTTPAIHAPHPDNLDRFFENAVLSMLMLAVGTSNAWSAASSGFGYALGRVSGAINWALWDSWHRRDEGIIYDADTETFFFECPHCKAMCEVPRSEINCTIFRHANFKSTMEFVPPHSSKEECERWVRRGEVYGCGKPFRFDGYSVEACDYI